jgi:putative alpha-1,2-mannosidase
VAMPTIPGGQIVGNPPAGINASAIPGDKDLTQYVNPLIGTANTGHSNNFDNNGNQSPMAVAPFPMIQWGPVTMDSDGPMSSVKNYFYTHTVIRGFPLTNEDSGGVSQGGELPVLPLLSASDTDYPTFSHNHETAQPGYYSVTLDNGIKVELTVTQRSGQARFHYPVASSTPTISIDTSRTNSNIGNHNAITQAVSSAITQDTLYSVSGYTQNNAYLWTLNQHRGTITDSRYNEYFTAVFDHPIQRFSVADGVARLTFAQSTTQVQMRTAVSYISVDNAKANLAAESPDFRFDETRQAALATWNQRLNVIQVDGGSDPATLQDDKTKFYTALYHMMMGMAVVSDVNGEYPSILRATSSINQVQQLAPGQQAAYGNFDEWGGITRESLSC